MLTNAQLADLRERLERSQNPIFIYDNDADGLCSYVLLRRFLGRGKGMAVRTHPDIDAGYARKALSLGADLVIVLDCPFLGDAFVEELVKASIPLLWIDHHVVDSPHYAHAHVTSFNPARSTKPSAEPVTYWCYKTTQRTEDMWIALMGCVADHYLPSFAQTFGNVYPEFWKQGIRKPFEAYYDSELGTLARALGFGLKDSVSHVVYLQNFLIGCSSPQLMLAELSSTSSFAETYVRLKKRYDALIAEALASPYDTVVFYQYSGTLSISSELANELSYRFPKQYTVVAYVNAGVCTMSIRGTNVKKILESLLPHFESSTGGGHPDAVGARIRADDIGRFREAFEKLVT
ncbi:MAG: DHH family phosphoesterase [Nanoarchaeota archaeon]